MSLEKATLKAALIDAANAAETASKGDNPNNDQIKSDYAEAVSNAMDAFVKSATITSVHTIGLTSPSGAVTGTIETTNTIS